MNKEGITTKEAYKLLINSEKAIKIADKIGMKISTFRVHKSEINSKSEYPTESVMGERLIKAGYTIIQEKLWGK